MNNIEALATRFIIEHGLYDYPLGPGTLEALCHQLGFECMDYNAGRPLIESLHLEKYTYLSAFACVQHSPVGTTKAILYNGAQPYSERHCAILHEIGHDALGHLNGAPFLHTGESLGDVQEQEADAFAEALAAPLCILQAEKIQKPSDIEEFSMLCRQRAERVCVALLEKTVLTASDLLVIEGYRSAKGIHIKKSPAPLANAQKRDRVFFITMRSMIVCLVLTIAGLITAGVNQKNQPIPVQYLTPESSAVSSEVSQPEEPPEPELSKEEAPPAGKVSQNQAAHTPSSSSEAKQQAAVTPVSAMVYITMDGDKYHRDGCQYLRTSRVEVSLDVAHAMGKEACLVCGPDVME